MVSEVSELTRISDNTEKIMDTLTIHSVNFARMEGRLEKLEEKFSIYAKTTESIEPEINELQNHVTKVKLVFKFIAWGSAFIATIASGVAIKLLSGD